MGCDTCQYGGEELLVLAYVGVAVPLPLLYFVREHHLRGGGERDEKEGDGGVRWGGGREEEDGGVEKGEKEAEKARVTEYREYR